LGPRRKLLRDAVSTAKDHQNPKRYRQPQPKRLQTKALSVHFSQGQALDGYPAEERPIKVLRLSKERRKKHLDWGSTLGYERRRRFSDWSFSDRGFSDRGFSDRHLSNLRLLINRLRAGKISRCGRPYIGKCRRSNDQILQHSGSLLLIAAV
jgi:hypothetical protein